MVGRSSNGAMEIIGSGGGSEVSSIKSATSSADDNQRNTAESLKKGIIRSMRGKVELTILLVGETGTGKTAMLKLLANVWHGRGPNDYKDFHDQSNETGEAVNGSQTGSAKLYEFPNSEGVNIRILDTPGLVDTRGLNQDKDHLASIAETIRTQVATVDAVIILANGTLARLGVATDYALTTLSAMFPKSLAQNIGFLFTNVYDHLAVNFDVESLPEVLRDNQLFLINNPVALREKYDREKQRQGKKPPRGWSTWEEKETLINNAHVKALDALARIFNWIDTLEPQPTKPIVELYEQVQDIDNQITAALLAIDEAATKKQELGDIRKKLEGAKMTMEQYKEYESIITRKVHRPFPTEEHNTLCGAPSCHGNCHLSCTLPFSVHYTKLWRCRAFIRNWHPATNCNNCGHPRDLHRHFKSVWREVDDEQISIDQEAKKKYEDAATDKEREEKLMSQVDDVIAQLNGSLQNITTRISDLIHEYAELSLTGSFRGQVQKTIRLLEENHEQMTSGSGSKHFDSTITQSVKEDIDYMKRRLEVLDKVYEEDSKNCLSRFKRQSLSLLDKGSSPRRLFPKQGWFYNRFLQVAGRSG